MDVRRGPGQRAGLTREAVLAAAHEVLAAGGSAESLTMRAVARRLDVAPNALYSHVESRTALLDDLLDELLAQVPVPSVDSARPVVALTRLMSSTWTVLTAHPHLVPHYLARQGARGPHAVRLGQSMDALLVAAGVHGADTATAREVLIVHTIGSAAFATGAALGEDAPRPPAPVRSRRTFTRSLRWLLAGIVHDAGGGAGEPSR